MDNLERATKLMAIVTAVLAIAIVVYFAALGVRSTRAETFRDNMGREVGTATTRGNTTTFTNNKGQETGYAVRNGNSTRFYNEKGQERGTATGRGK